MAGYTRQSSANMVSGNTIYASDHNNEYNAIQSAFDGNTGHAHDGSTGNGPKINLNTSIVGTLPIVNGGTGGINNLSATGAPTTSSDSNAGYRVGSLWIDTTNDILYVCVDATVASAIWIRHQVFSFALASIANLATTANQMIYTTGSNLYATTALTPFGRSLIDDADAAAGRATLALGTMATQNAASVAITGGTISGVSVTGITDLAIADGGTGASDAATARTNLGLGTIATQNANAVSITGGTISGITDIAIADGGTGASTASDARTNLGLGTLATLNTINNNNWSGTNLSISNGGTGASDAATARTNLGLGNVDNTSDANKPVSTAQQTALDLKYDKTGGDIGGRVTIKNTASYGLNIQGLNTQYQGVQAMFLANVPSGGSTSGFGPKVNFHKAGLVQWNFGIGDGAANWLGWFLGASEGAAGSLRAVLDANGNFTLYNGTDNAVYQPNGDHTFSGTMATAMGAVSLSQALSQRPPPYTGANTDETNYPIGTVIPVQGSFGTGTPRSYTTAIYLNNNFAFSTSGTTQLLGTWRLVGTISSSVAIFRRVQ